MNVRIQIGMIGALAAASPALARADHGDMAMGGGGGSQVTAGVSLVAAQFATPYYGGNYEGIVPALDWSRHRFSAGASLGAYRIDENGYSTTGIGDLLVHGEVAVLDRPAARAGVSLAASDPIGNAENGLGMGHVMVMAAGWGMWQRGCVALHAMAGYSRAVGVPPGSHDHGPWPLVDPMNMSEIAWSAAGDVALGRGARAGARFEGGIPVGALPGHERVIGALRLAWDRGAVATAAELQAGLVGDPFSIRAVLETALTF